MCAQDDDPQARVKVIDSSVGKPPREWPPLEAGVLGHSQSEAVALSQAISLKRIADVMERLERLVAAPQNVYGENVVEALSRGITDAIINGFNSVGRR